MNKLLSANDVAEQLGTPEFRKKHNLKSEPPMTEYLYQLQASKFLGINEAQLTSLCRRRLVAYCSPCKGTRLFLEEDLRKYLELRRVEARWSIEDAGVKDGGSATAIPAAASTRNLAARRGENPLWRNVKMRSASRLCPKPN